MTKPSRTKRVCPVCVSIKRKPPQMITLKSAERCVQCYYDRVGMPSKARPKTVCPKCGKPKSYRATLCVECHYERGSKKPPPPPPPPPREPLTTFDEAWTVWQRTIGQSKERYGGPAKGPRKSKRKRVLVIPDLHVPFEESEMVAEMLVREAPHTDVAIQIGDISDSYSLSRFAKYEAVSFAQEWAKVTLMMQTLSETFGITKIIIGNHDARLRKALAAQLTPDMLDAVTTMTGGTLCPVTALAKKFKNIEIVKHDVPHSDHTVDWLHVEGDAVLAHPEKYSRIPGTALRAFEEWVVDNSTMMGLDGMRLFIMGHTHQMGIVPWRAKSLLVECGCLCQTQGYMTGARIGGRPQRRGYITFDQVNDVTDLNSVKMHWMDVEDRWNRSHT